MGREKGKGARKVIKGKGGKEIGIEGTKLL
jgi:hypothetical protein